VKIFRPPKPDKKEIQLASFLKHSLKRKILIGEIEEAVARKKQPFEDRN